MRKHYAVDDIHFEGDDIILSIDGKRKRYPLREISPCLFNASDSERNMFEISPSGYGIHWPLLDEDISIDGLLGVTHHPKEKTKVA